jgi:hypothetical protein
LELRKTFGHPHWFIFDEAHHLIPKGAANSFFNIPRDLNNFMLVTTEPELINPAIVSHTDLAIVIGKDPHNIINQYAQLKENSIPGIAVKELIKEKHGSGKLIKESRFLYELKNLHDLCKDIRKNMRPVICRITVFISVDPVTSLI